MKKYILVFLIVLGSVNSKYAQPKDSLQISFQSEGYKLDGKLIKPSNPEGKVSAIIFLPGSGGYSSHSRDYKTFLDFFLESPLKEQDVSFLYFDKRGVAPSEGKWFKTTFEERAIDAKNAAEYLKTLPYIDKDRIYLVGHSQGGWIVQIALAEYPGIFAGGISMAGPTFGVRDQVINEYQSKIICSEDLPAEEAWKKATRQVKGIFTFVSILPFKEDWKQLNRIKKFEPSSYLLKVKKPLLLMFAENDALVDPSRSINELNKLFPGGIPENMSTYVASGENHSFKKSPFCYKGKLSELEFSSDSRDKMKDWLLAEINNYKKEFPSARVQ